MEYQEQRTAYGKFMFKITLNASKFLMGHMWLYYLLSYTWGLLTTLLGWIGYLFVRIFLCRKIVDKGKFGPCHWLMFGDKWGGLEMGTNFFIADNMSDYWILHTKEHELGHTFQNAVLGPFAIVLVFIPSFIRYWHQEIRERKHKDNKPYDLIWFEGSASTIGNVYRITK